MDLLSPVYYIFTDVDIRGRALAYLRLPFCTIGDEPSNESVVEESKDATSEENNKVLILNQMIQVQILEII